MGSLPTVRPDTIEQVCPRYPVAKLGDLIPAHFRETLEQNQKIATCCRHPEDHEVSAWKSRPEEPAPDIYIFHCTCGRDHRRFMAGQGDMRPYWEVR